MNTRKLLTQAAFIGALAATTPALATIVVVNDALNAGITTFDNTVTAAGETVVTIELVSGTNSYNYIDKDGNAATMTIQSPDGTNVSWSGPDSSGSISMTGDAARIDPFTTAGEIIPGFNSGFELVFSSGVNSLGFETGDWATCCYSNTRPQNIIDDYGVPATGSGLWIAFDGASANLTANALQYSDNPGIGSGTGSDITFIAALDDSGSFNKVTFFGDGFGEVLFAGGTIRLASVDQGSLPPVGVPVPAPLALLALGLIGVAVRARKA